MIPINIRFLSDEGDAPGIDLDLLNEHRGRIRRKLLRDGDDDASSLSGGRNLLTIVDLPNGDYLAVAWFFESDEDAIVFSVAAGEVEAPPEE